MKPEDIAVSGRHRKDYGDIDGLAASIDDIGLLNPIVVDGEGRLVAGGRRLAACLHLGWDDIPVIVAMNLTEAGAALRAERDENTQRKDFLPSEIASIGRALEEHYRPEAAARQGNAGQPRDRLAPGSQTVAKPQRVREQVGEALGVSGASYERIKSIANDADDASLPEPRRVAAAAALADLDNQAPIRATFEQYRKEHTVQQPTAGQPNKQPAKTTAVPSIETTRGLQIANKHKARVFHLVSSVWAPCLPGGIDRIDLNAVRSVLTDDELTELIDKQMGHGLRELGRLRRELLGARNDH